MENSSELFLVFFILALSFTCFLLYTTMRLCQTGKFVHHWRYTKLIYIFQSVQLMLRSVCFWVICVMSDTLDLTENAIFAIFSLPDCLIVASYVLIFWVMLNCTRHSRIDSELSLAGGNNLVRAGKFTLALLVIILGIDLMLYGLMFLGVVSNKSISIQQGIISFLASAMVTAGLIVVQVKFSGMPFKTVQAGKYMNTVIFITCIWTLGRILHGVIYVIMTGSLNGGKLSTFNNMVSDSKTIILIIIDLLVTELMCYYFVLDYSFFRIFMNDFIDETLSSQILGKNAISMQYELEKSDELFEVIDPKTLAISEQKGKLGLVAFTGVDKQMVVKRVTLPRINKYVLENLQKDVEDIKSLNIESLAMYTECQFYSTEVALIMKFFPFSLYSLLHKTKKTLTILKKLEILLKVAETLKQIHFHQRFHGHLTSANILLTPDLQPHIADLGMEHFKKYCGLINTYCNKSAWSSPEILKEPSNVVTKAQTSDDVYSFGILMWEVLCNSEPFPGYSLNKLREMIVEHEYKPAVEGLGIKGAEELIKLCWNKVPANRPDFELIEKELAVMINNL